MAFIVGKDRDQMMFSTLSDVIEAENSIRFIEAFIEKIDLAQLGFQAKRVKEEGRPSFDPKVLMKLYLYGYLNGVRSSKKLEREYARIFVSRREPAINYTRCCEQFLPFFHFIYPNFYLFIFSKF